MPAQHPSPASSLSITLQILSIVFYTFIAFICIGLPIAVLPSYVHDQLGFSAIVAGLAIASQYLATLLSRPSAGRLVDSIGTKPAIVYGLAGIAISGVLTSLAVALQDWPLLSLGVL
ncbi:MAG: MFS transporter, partial [Pseudomonas sp.]|nr:MFS transporter [Pseudomonas sp.]